MFIPKEYVQYADMEKLKNLSLTDSGSIIELSEEIAKITRAVNQAEGTTKYAFPSGESIATAFTYFYQDVIDRNSGFIMRYGEKIKNLYMDDAFKEACRIAAEWVEEGLLPDDAAVQDRLAWQNGNMLKDKAYAVMVAQAYGTEEQVSAQRSGDWGIEVEAIRLHDKYFMINGWSAGGNGVTASSKHPEEALKFIEAINTEKGKDIYNAIVYGLEGRHYEKIDDTHIGTLDWETYYEEFVTKMEAAGVQKAIDEFQSQYDAWKAGN